MLSPAEMKGGQAQVWKSGQRDSLITVHNYEVSKLAFGENHCVFLTSAGQAFSFGNGSHGQLGTGNCDDHHKEPVRVLLPQCDIGSPSSDSSPVSSSDCDCKVVDVACGPNHSASVMMNGQVYMWGCSSGGQCGTFDSTILIPRQVKIVDNKDDSDHPRMLCDKHKDQSDDGTNFVRVIQIACGNEHTVALSSSHEVWVWGKGPAQLGLINVQFTCIPVIIPYLSSKRVLSVSCGFDHTAVIVQKSVTCFGDALDSSGSSVCVKCLDKQNVKSCSVKQCKMCPLGLPLDASSSSISSSASGTENIGSKMRETDYCRTKSDAAFSGTSSNENNDKVKASETELVNCENSDKNLSMEGDIPDSDHKDVTRIECCDVSPDGQSKSSDIDIRTTDERINLAADKLDTVTVSSPMSEFGDKSDTFVQIRDRLSNIRHQLSTHDSCKEGFVDVAEEMKEFVRNLSTADSKVFYQRSSSLVDLESDVSTKVRERRNSSSVDKLLLDNKNKYRTQMISHKDANRSVKEFYDRRPMKGILQTELWTWGKGRQGQLGHGDMLERMQPFCVQKLASKNIVKVIAAGNHTVIMTTDCQVYTAGSNKYGQLGHSGSLPSVCSPDKIKVPDLCLIWDIAANNNTTIFLADGPNKQIGIYSCGGHNISNTDENQAEKVSVPTYLSFLTKGRNICRVYAGGSYCGFRADKTDSVMINIFHEFAMLEKHSSYMMKMLLEEALTPLLHDDVMKNETVSITTLKVLISIYTELTDSTAINCFDLAQLLQEGSEVMLARNGILGVYMVDEPNEYLQLITKYISSYCDCIAVNSMSVCFKAASAFFDKIRYVLDELSEMSSPNVKSTNASDILLHLLKLPCLHVKDYVNFMSRLPTLYNQSSEERRCLQDLTGELIELNDTWKKSLDIAEKTHKFWTSVPPRIAESLKEHERRFIQDSKSHPATLHASSRFSSHWFILFNDVFIHSQFSGLQAYYLVTLWADVVPESEIFTNTICLTTPEETLHITCSSSQLKTEWVCALNKGIKTALSNPASKKAQSKEHRLYPPLARYASHTFSKNPALKDATYTGMWLCGKLHGEGLLEWPNGRKYVGKFKQNEQHGHGTETVPSDFGSSAYTIYDGEWKNGLMNGLGTVKYPNGDVYEGYFVNGQRSGHGTLKKGQFLSTAASVYIGEWEHNQRHGYGVNDDVMAGEKYLGWWENDCRHGNGVIVTIDGIYYEGIFNHNKMSGYGLVIFEDNTNYEGELSGSGTFNGKGTLYLSNGDNIDGTFNGRWNDGVKVNGIFNKSTQNQSNNQHCDVNNKLTFPKSFGKLSVPADKKWGDIFKHCTDLLGIEHPPRQPRSEITTKAWENVAVTIANWKKFLQQKPAFKIKEFSIDKLDGLDIIPRQSILSTGDRLYHRDFIEIKCYLTRVFDCMYHPLGQMVNRLVDVFRATYIGVGAHPRLLIHAIDEIKSHIARIYPVVRILFPVLPREDDHTSLIENDECIESSDQRKFEESADDDDSTNDVVTPFTLLFPLLLPRIYSPLFMLYALHNESQDEQYWERLVKWNKQSDVTLLNFLGVDQKFWLTNISQLTEKRQQDSLHTKEEFFGKSVETLQHLSTTFSPQEKLHVIHQTFKEINTAVEDKVGQNVMWTMDELFPVFQYTVVRARIRHLGSEVHFIDDFIESRLENGELGLMFTTLKACYFQIQNEKVNW